MTVAVSAQKKRLTSDLLGLDNRGRAKKILADLAQPVESDRLLPVPPAITEMNKVNSAMWDKILSEAL